MSKDSQTKVDKNTLFEIASITKILTSNLIAQAVIENKIELEDYIDNYLPKAYVLNKNLVRMMLGKQVELKDRFWSVINLNTSIFFSLLGFINLYVAYNFSEDTWVNFKLFGLTGLLLVYMILMTLYISKVSKG